MKHKHLIKKALSLERSNPKEAAEYYYALGLAFKKEGDDGNAVKFGNKAIDSLNRCELGTAEKCAPIHVKIGEIPLPSSFFHQDVVRQNFQPLLLS